MSAEAVRNQLRALSRRTPFEPFIIAFSGGEMAVIEHPENVAFDPTPGGSAGFYVYTGRLQMFGRFDAVSSITTLTAAISSANGHPAGP